MSSRKRNQDVDRDSYAATTTAAIEVATNPEAGKADPGESSADKVPSAEAPGAARDTSGTPDPFSPEALRLSQDFASDTAVKRELLTVPVRKPSKERWVRIHPDEDYRIDTRVLELKEENEIYLVSQSLWPELAMESTVSARRLHTAIDRQGSVFIWPIRLPAEDGTLDQWNRSALEAAELARQQWVRVAANREHGFYDVFTTEADLPEPGWPEIAFRDLLKIAFKDRMIGSLDHEVLKRLRGEI